MVNHYSSNRATAPLVNVYCGGALAGSYGAAPDLVEGFSRGSARNGDIWRVVDITTRVSGDSITCELSPVRPSDPSEGLYSITRGGDLSF